MNLARPVVAQQVRGNCTHCKWITLINARHPPWHLCARGQNVSIAHTHSRGSAENNFVLLTHTWTNLLCLENFMSGVCSNKFCCFFVFQRQHFRGPMAERQTTRAGCGDAGAMVVPGRVDAGLQGTLRSAPVGHVERQVRRYLGQWTAGRLWLRDLRRRGWVPKSTRKNLTLRNLGLLQAPQS